MRLNMDSKTPAFDSSQDRHWATAAQKLSAAYRGEGEVVPVVSYGGFDSGYAYRERLLDQEKMRAHALGLMQTVHNTRSDLLPYVDTYCTVANVAQAFGCEIEMEGNGMPRAKPLFDRPEQLCQLRTPRIESGSLAARSLAWIDYAQQHLGTTQPMWTVDIQSPFNVAAEILDACELLMACVTHPVDVHRTLQAITEFSIQLTLDHIRRMERPCFPGRNFPSIEEHIGICVADDTPVVLLGPDLYREFALPYNTQISKAFGGLHIHSCGNYRQNLEVLLETPGLRSLQMHVGPGEFAFPEPNDQDPKWLPWRQALATKTIFIDTNQVARGDGYAAGQGERFYREYLLPRLPVDIHRRLILQSYEIGTEDKPVALRVTKEMFKHHQ